jgi:uncharacterized protein YbjT (DUF2867 family)
MSTLVIGGTGTIGSRVVSRLAERGEPIRVATRSTEKTHKLPSVATGVVADLEDPASLLAALQGIERVVLITPLDPNEARMGTNAVRAARESGVRRLVYLSVHQVHRCPEAPHFRSKIEIQKAIEDSGIPFTLIMPNNFFQNDDRMQAAIVEHGVYPQPIGGVGINRVDAGDVADAIVTAVTTPGHEGEHYPVVGPDTLTGEMVATIYTQHLRRPIQYIGDDLEAWKRLVRDQLPPWLVEDLEIMLRFFQREGLKATDADFAKQARVLGHPPRAFDDYAEAMAKLWTSHAASR